MSYIMKITFKQVQHTEHLNLKFSNFDITKILKLLLSISFISTKWKQSAFFKHINNMLQMVENLIRITQ